MGPASVRGLLLLSCAGIFAAGSSAQNISTVAGGGSALGLAATARGANAPQAVAVDPGGNLYVALAGANQVWVINPGGIVTSVIGTGTGGYSGDGGPASSAQLSDPVGVAVDAGGNIYISDSANNVIRKVTVGTGIISTIAGNGTSGYTGNGGQATSAELFEPGGIALDASGNLYIADFTNQVVREVSATTGIINNVAGNHSSGNSGDGGPATSAQLHNPAAVAVDSSGNLYIADYSNNLIRKVTATTGNISTAAGGGGGFDAGDGDGGLATSATLRSPLGVTVDASGNVFVADGGDNAVRKVTLATGIISSVAGNSTAGYSGDGSAATSAELNFPAGVAFDSGGNLYVADGGNNVVRLITAATGKISTILGNGTAGLSGDGGPATSAQLYLPFDVALDAAGDLYVADRSNNAVRKVTAATGIINTVAGNGVAGYTGDGGAATSAELSAPSGVALDSSGNLYIADLSNAVVRKVSAATGLISTVAGNNTVGYSGNGGAATSAQLDFPWGVAVDSSGNLFIADAGNYVIRKVAAATGIITTVAGNHTAGYSGDGAAATSAQLGSLDISVAVDSSGNLYIVDTGSNNVIRKVTAATGLISTVAGTNVEGYTGDGGAATSARLNSPTGVAVDSSGNIYISDQGNSVIRRVASATGIISTIAGNGAYGFSGDGGLATGAQIASPYGLRVNSSGEVFVADAGNNRVRAITAAPDVVTHFAVTAPASGTVGTPFNFTVTALDSGGSTVAGYSGTVHFTSSDAGTTLPANSTLTNGVGSFSATPHNAVNQTVTATDTVSAGITGNSGTIAVASPAAPSYLPPFLMATYAAPSIAVGGTTTLSFSVFNPNQNLPLSNVGFTFTVPAGLKVTSPGSSNTNCGPVTTASGSIALVGGALVGNGSCGFSVSITGLAAGTQDGYSSSISTTQVTGYTPAFARLIVTPGTQTITFSTPATHTYGDAPFVLTATATSGLPVTFTVTSGPCSVSSATVKITGAGSCVIAGSQPGNTNYAAASSASQTIVISKATLTVSANNASGSSGEVLPSFSANYSGYVNGDTAAAITGTPALTAAATVTSPAGSYPITVTAGSLSSANYSFAFVNGTLTLGPMPLSNGGSYGPGAVAPNTILTYFGPVSCLPNEAVLINGTAAAILFANATQINFVSPGKIAGSFATIEIVCNNTATTLTAPVTAANPTLFTDPGTGTGQGAIVNFDGAFNSAARPAGQGTYISVFGTGFGSFAPAGTDGLQHLAGTVTAAIGGANATVVYAGQAPGETPGLQQINIRVPTGITPGSAVPIVLAVNGVATQNGVTVAVQ